MVSEEGHESSVSPQCPLTRWQANYTWLLNCSDPHNFMANNTQVQTKMDKTDIRAY